jgi:hypothetical protein
VGLATDASPTLTSNPNVAIETVKNVVNIVRFLVCEIRLATSYSRHSQSFDRAARSGTLAFHSRRPRTDYSRHTQRVAWRRCFPGGGSAGVDRRAIRPV